MNNTWDSADIDQAIGDLLRAGWQPRNPTTWEAPDGTLHRGPAAAWNTMQRLKNDARFERQLSE